MEEILRIQNLSKRYGDMPVLDHVDLSVKKGEVVVIVGPSGCGKSTFLRCMNALEEIQEGKVLLDGELINPCRGKLNLVRQRIGMVFQSYELFPHKTVLQNMTLAPVRVKKKDRREAEEEAREMLERVGLLSRKDSYPRQLSGGQKQRVAIVRALMMHPEVLLLDEITAALDAQTAHRVSSDILDLTGITRIVVTHSLEESLMRRYDKILVMKDGRIEEEGTFDELMAKKDYFHALFTVSV